MVLFVGTSGWQYRDWSGVFYPQLHWQSSGHARVARIGLGADRLITTWSLDRLLTSGSGGQ
ncbi:hypothetical protein [Streptomyces virginiae]|uniref:DUF72 domain-containing protein n=1 Tax=Streptomyces virginiae TaxID=1961 RepID=A0ABZ1TN69_STRVG|nr:hypothetical protein [Streptomyces virginiae]